MSSHQGLVTAVMSGHSGLSDKGVCVCVCVCEGSKTEREFWKLANVSSRGTYVCVCDTLACQTRVCVCVCVCVCTHSKTEREFWKPANVSSIGTCYFLAQISVFLTIKWGHLPWNGCK